MTSRTTSNCRADHKTAALKQKSSRKASKTRPGWARKVGQAKRPVHRRTVRGRARPHAAAVSLTTWPAQAVPILNQLSAGSLVPASLENGNALASADALAWLESKKFIEAERTASQGWRWLITDAGREWLAASQLGGPTHV